MNPTRSANSTVTSRRSATGPAATAGWRAALAPTAGHRAVASEAGWPRRAAGLPGRARGRPALAAEPGAGCARGRTQFAQASASRVPHSGQIHGRTRACGATIIACGARAAGAFTLPRAPGSRRPGVERARSGASVASSAKATSSAMAVDRPQLRQREPDLPRPRSRYSSESVMSETVVSSVESVTGTPARWSRASGCCGQRRHDPGLQVRGRAQVERDAAGDELGAQRRVVDGARPWAIRSG